VVRQKIIAARDLIKCHPLTPGLATELFTSNGMGVFRFSAALVEWSESELNDVKRLCVQACKNAWHLPRSTASALFIFPKTHAGKRLAKALQQSNISVTWAEQLDNRLASVHTTGKLSWAAATRSIRECKMRIERI